MSNAIKRLLVATSAGVLLSSAINAAAAPLVLSDEPLFLGYTVDPNVFFMLDDSGSMDWEVTATPHWDACGYDSAYPLASCSITLRSAGAMHLYRWRERKLSTDVAWSSNGSTGTSSFQYVFSSSDNMYGGACNAGNTSLASCVASLNNTASTTENVTCTGPATCNAPGGYEFTFCSGTAGTTARRCGWYTPYNHRWNVYRKDWRAYSSSLNTTYYNPAVTYTPWDGTGMTDASFTAVRSHPQSGQTGYSLVRNLSNDMADLYEGVPTGFVYEVWDDTHGYTGTQPDKTDRTDGANGIVDVWDEHDRYVVTSTSITKYRVTYTLSGGLVENVGLGLPVLIDSEGRTPDQIRQNIANWYQYSRRRMLMAKGAIGKVITQNDDFRFGLSVINQTATTASTASTTDHSTIFAKVPDAGTTDYATHNTTLLDNLYKFINPAMGTPLRRGLDNAGRYYSGQTVYSPGSASLSSTTYTNPMTESCQHNFTVLFTDGYWNESGDPATTAIGDYDGDGYTGASGSENTTVADVARYYAARDLNASFPNNVPVIGDDGTPTGDETFQHMVTFTAAFGLLSELRDLSGDDDLPDTLVEITTGVASSFTPGYSARWGDNPWDSNTGKIDDLWHAAYNSDGDFISASTPQELVDGLQEVMRAIDAQTGSSSSVAASSGSFRADTLLFLAKFVSEDWSGEVLAYPLVDDGSGNISISTTPVWSAKTKLETLVGGTGWLTDREVLTYNPSLVNGSRQGKGVPFLFPASYLSLDPDSISIDQIAELVPNSVATLDIALIAANQAAGTDLVSWVRGAEIGSLRDRVSVLGDIVDSSPQFVAAPQRQYPDILESKPYSAFRATHTNRTPILYVGANDGMLHAFNATSGASGGTEVFAYVPASVYGRLTNLASSTYGHQYTVNGTVEINDVFYGGAWHTVLVGGLGAGGQGIYALDITDGPSVDEGDAANTVLWEFTDQNHVTDATIGEPGANGDANLGYTYSRPQLVKTRTGKWMAVFGNGYNNTAADGSASTTGYAYLYFVDIETGKLERRLEIPVGSAATPNGLATVSVIDLNTDYIADYVYAGDLYGNLWRIDMNHEAADDWEIAYDGKPVFTTQTDQPITVKPAVARHPTGTGVIVYFGTGKYVESSDADADDQTTNTFYAVWDSLGVGSAVYPIERGELLEQEILAETTHSGSEVRVTSDTAIDWSTHRGWFIDLEYSGNNGGELIATDPIVRGERVIFISIVPATSPCETGGSSWIYELDYADGSRLPYSPIDVNGDGVIDADDRVSYDGADVAGGGFKNDNIITSPTILADTQSTSREQKVFSTSAGTFLQMGESTDGIMGRRSWRQLL